ncbi:MAG: class I SAM-dependent methyltransferase [Noviherbaspirillum sp.]
MHTALDQPSAWVARFAPIIPSGEVLDLACGGGRHARLLAELGHPVLAVDRDAGALARTAGPAITTQQIDLESGHATWPFEPGRFAGIVVTNYLHRPLFPGIFRSLAAGGVLIYETFAAGNEYFGKPSNPLFLLKRGELLDVVAKESRPSLHVVAYEDGHVLAPKPAIVQRICVLNTASHSPADSLPRI